MDGRQRGGAGDPRQQSILFPNFCVSHEDHRSNPGAVLPYDTRAVQSQFVFFFRGSSEGFAYVIANGPDAVIWTIVSPFIWT